VRGAYGAADQPPPHTQLAYTHASADWQCVDDPASKHYTQIVDRRQLAVDWTSAEAMHRRDALYTWVIDIAHNPRAEPGAGSCIFFHVWRNAHAGTVGCTAMPAPAIRQLISQLAPSAIYVLLPRAEYAALAPAWDLPAAN
jgi:D-alanyl-D-alanine dipeptidase